MGGASVLAAAGLQCRECGKTFLMGPQYACDACFGPLEPIYDYGALPGPAQLRARIASGPASMWRYADLLPVAHDPETDLQAGFTPLLHARRLGRLLGLERLFLKNDAVNPTWSFKDRVVSVAAAAARRFGFEVLACASTGNLANSVAAHAARAGMPAYVFIPAGLERPKVVTSAIYHPTIVEVEGTYDDVNRLCAQIADERPWAFVNVNLRPFYAEGAKTLAYEVAEQLGWHVPDHIVVPVASGNLLVKITKGFRELQRLRLVEASPAPRVHGAQAAGCSPVARAFREGREYVDPVVPDTIARSLAIGNPADGRYVLQIARSSGGVVEAVSDQEIVEGIALLARTEGIFTETAGGTTVAVLQRLAERGAFGRDETVVAYITGMGLKTLDAAEGVAGRAVTIAPTLRSFEQALHEAVAAGGRAGHGLAGNGHLHGGRLQPAGVPASDR
ncbi:threonine synthase [Carboxydichorda subterranea]